MEEKTTTFRSEFLNEVHIREAVFADTDTLVEFNLRMAEETESLTLDRERLRRGVEAVLQDSSKGVYYVAEHKGRILGQLLLTYEWSDWRNGMFWWIQSVYVLPEFRRMKIFSALYNFVKEHARSSPSVCGLRLYVEERNEKAFATYTAVGMNLTHYRIMEDDFVLRQK